jgi:hypothetical protein
LTEDRTRFSGIGFEDLLELLTSGLDAADGSSTGT